jgi:hypothetical protein
MNLSPLTHIISSSVDHLRDVEFQDTTGAIGGSPKMVI